MDRSTVAVNRWFGFIVLCSILCAVNFPLLNELNSVFSLSHPQTALLFPFIFQFLEEAKARIMSSHMVPHAEVFSSWLIWLCFKKKND